MDRRRLVVAALAALPLAVSSLLAGPPATLAKSRSSAAVALGPITVKPAQVRVGGLVNVSGRTVGQVQFLPPAITMQSAKTVLVHFGPGGCQGTQQVPAAEASVSKGGGFGGKGALSNPPAGTAWHIHFHVPAHMRQLTSNSTLTVAPVPGKYYISAVAGDVGAGCGVITKGSTFISVATITLGS